MNTLLRPSLLALVACSALVSSMTAMITMTPPGPQFGGEIPLELHNKTIMLELPTNEAFRHLANSSRGLFAFPADRTDLTVKLNIVYEFQGKFSEGARPVQTTTTISPSVQGFGFTPIARMYGQHIENREISENYQAIAEKAAALSAARGVVADMLYAALCEVTGSTTPTALGFVPRSAFDTAPAHAAHAYPLTGWRAVLAPLAPYCPCLRQRRAGEEAQPLTLATAYADGDNHIDHTDPQARIKNKVLLLILLQSLLSNEKLVNWVIGDSAGHGAGLNIGADEFSNPAGEFEGGSNTPLPQAEVVTKTKETLFYFFTHGHEMIARYCAPQPSAVAATAHSPRAAGAGSDFDPFSPEPGFVGGSAAVTTPRANTARRLALSGPADATPPLATAASPALIEEVLAAGAIGVTEPAGHEGTTAAETDSKEA